MHKFVYIIFISLSLFTNAQEREFSPVERIKNPKTIDVSALYSGSLKAIDAQKAAAQKIPIEIKLKKSGIVFRLIPKGRFLKGSPKSEKGRANDEAMKSVTINDSFYMGKFEVSQRQWKEVMGENPGYFNSDENLPVENVSWADCMVFISKLEALEGLKTGSLNFPSEVQWEYACRAGTLSPFYSGSSSQALSKVGWFYENAGTESLAGKKYHSSLLKSNKNQSKLPGQKFPNAFGLFDMHGNVWEWCSNIYSYKNNSRVIKGGGWNIAAPYCRSAARRYNNINKKHPSIGLRLMLKADYNLGFSNNFEEENKLKEDWPEAFQNRTGENKAKAIAKYIVSPENQEAVLKALKWLKSVQKPDGSWGSAGKAAMTSFALMTFLANGENNNSAEFGETVTKAIAWLVQDKIDLKSSHAYPHAIKTIALAEAYGVTNSASVKEVLDKCIKPIIDGLRLEGSFDYNYKLDSSRNDLSFSAWNYKAFKAMHNVAPDHPGLKAAIQKCITWLKGSTTGEFVFQYSTDGKTFKKGKAKHTMRAAGIVSLQSFGGGNFPDLQDDLKTVALSDVLNIRWGNPIRESLYGWYYATQGMFNYNNTAWVNWNSRIQTLLPSKQHEDGYWIYPGSYHGANIGDEVTQQVYATSLCVLILSTAYRNVK